MMQTVRFGDIAKNINERILPENAEGLPYVGLEHLDPESLKIRRWGSPDDVGAQKLRFYVGDIIFGKRRYYQKKLAVAEFDGICSAHAMVLRAKPDVVLPEFLPFFMQSEMFFERAMAISVGSLSPTINWGTLKKQEFPLPPLDEQRRIAEILWAVEDTWSAYYDVLVEGNALEFTLRNHLFSGIDNWVNLGEICAFATGKLDSNCAEENGKYPFFTCDPETLRIDRYSFDTEAILLAGNNAVGVFPIKHYRGKFDAYQRTYVITVKDTSRIRYKYLMLALSNALEELRRLSIGSTTKYLTMKILNGLKIPIPGITLQDNIVSQIQECRNTLEYTELHMHHVKTLKMSFLHRIF